MLKIEQAAVLALSETVEDFDAAVQAFVKQIRAHSKTINVPRPTAHPVLELIVLQHGGEYEITYPIAEAAPLPEPEPKQTFADRKLERYAELARHRYNAELAGIEYGGVKFGCDAESLIILSNALAAAGDNEHYIFNWKVGPGDYRQLKQPALVEILAMVRARVQWLFDHEYELAQEIKAARGFEALLAVDIEKGWAE
jgi:hypothetical protein